MRLRPILGYKASLHSADYFHLGLPSAYMIKQMFTCEKADKVSQLTWHAGHNLWSDLGVEP